MKIFFTVFIAVFCAAAQAAPYSNKIASPAAFGALASPSFLATSAGLPMVMVLLDRTDSSVYYINRSSYPLHMDFINTHLLSLDNGLLFVDMTDGERRRFMTGFLVKRRDCLTLELWPDDDASPELLSDLYGAVRAGLYKGCLKVNPLSENHLRLRTPQVPFYRNYPQKPGTGYQAISEGVSYGRLHLARALSGAPATGTIYVLKEPPKYLAHGLAGFITSESASALSHVCILARTLGIPALHVQDAERLLRKWDGRDIRLEVFRSSYSVTAGSPELTAAYQRGRAATIKRRLFADLEWKELTPLHEQLSSDVPRFGAKSANLGQVASLRISDIEVPPGFTIPFYYYGQFIRENGLGDAIEALLRDPAMADPAGRESRLAALRAAIAGGRFNPVLEAEVRARLEKDFKGKGVFVRSSTNSEDLPGFSGAGLYTTVPNVADAGRALKAIKEVWASVWNLRAFDAREVAGIEHRTAMPAVLIQEAKDSDISGVMFTKSDLGEHSGCVEIGTKKGLGIRVVEGHADPERSFYCGEGPAVTASLSGDDKMLRFAQGGGVEEKTIPAGRPLLETALAGRLARAGLAIEKGFGGVPQDIEWLVIGGRIYIVQSRPYVFSKGK